MYEKKKNKKKKKKKKKKNNEKLVTHIIFIEFDLRNIKSARAVTMQKYYN